jgi:tetratricopeptide (TPR) repeat protein
VTDLYSVRDVARLFRLQESRLRYWAQTGFVGPSARKRGRPYYTFQDLIGVKLAKELLDGGLTLQRVRRNLDALRAQLPAVDRPLSRLKICSDGDSLVVVDADVAYQPESGQLVMGFAVSALATQVAEVTALRAAAGPDADDGDDVAHGDAAARHGIDLDIDAGDEPGAPRSAYGWFLQGVGAQAAGDERAAEVAYRRAVARDPALAAAHTNLGNLLHRRGELAAARAAYERALELDPEQPEARFNLGNVLDDLGETELAIAELRGVCGRCPEFADAHFNLSLILARVGGVAQARAHLGRYLELDPDSAWSQQAQTFLAELARADN